MYRLFTYKPLEAIMFTSDFLKGSFLIKYKVYFADYKHFATNTPFLIGASEGSMFRLPDYYDYSTNKSYVEGNVRLESGRIVLKRLPVLDVKPIVSSRHTGFEGELLACNDMDLESSP